MVVVLGGVIYSATDCAVFYELGFLGEYPIGGGICAEWVVGAGVRKSSGDIPPFIVLDPGGLF